jgi:hypothetical protein
MPRKVTPTYVLLNQVTLAATASEVAFSNLPQNYSDLVVVIDGSSSSITNWRIRFNGDSGANYSFIALSGTGSGTAGNTYINEVFATYVWQNYSATTSRMMARLQIMDYSALDKHKTMLARSDSGVGSTELFANRWGNTAAVTSFNLFPQNTTWVSGTSFYLYGIVA